MTIFARGAPADAYISVTKISMISMNKMERNDGGYYESFPEMPFSENDMQIFALADARPEIADLLLRELPNHLEEYNNFQSVILDDAIEIENRLSTLWNANRESESSANAIVTEMKARSLNLKKHLNAASEHLKYLKNIVSTYQDEIKFQNLNKLVYGDALELEINNVQNTINRLLEDERECEEWLRMNQVK